MADSDKFSMLFEVVGEGVETLSSINSAMDNIASKAGAIGNVSMDGIISGFKDIAHEAATFQDIESSLQFSFGKDKWKGVYEDVKKDAAQLTFTLQEVSELASSLGKMHINPFGGEDAASQTFLARTGERIRALEVLQDTADAAGKSTSDLTIAIRNAMSGQWISLATRFDIPKEKINSWKKEIDKLSTSQEKYNMLVSKLALDYGGAGKLKDMNWNKVAAQLPDLVQQLKGGAGAEGLKILTASLKEFINALTGMAKDADFLKALSDAFLLLAKGAAFLIDIGTRLVHVLRGIVTAFPALPQVLLVAAGLSIVTASVLALTAAFVGMGVALSTIGLPVILTFLAASVIGLVVAVTSIAAIIMLASTAFDIWGDKTNGVASTFERFKIVLEAVQEALNNWAGETTEISEETKNRLDDIGMADTFLEIIGALQRVKTFFDEFATGFANEWKVIGEPVKVSMLALVDAVRMLGTALGMSFGGAKTDINGAKTEGQAFGAAMADSIGFVAGALTWVMGIVIDLIADIGAAASTFADWYFYVAYFWNTLQMVGDLLGASVVVSASVVLSVFENILQAVEGIVTMLKAAAAVMTGDFAGAAKEWEKGGAIIDRMKQSWTETGKTYDKWESKFAEDRKDVDKAFDVSQKIANFGAKVDGNMAAAKARNEEYARSKVSSQGISFAEMTPEEIQELDKRSKYDTQLAQPNMSVDRLGDAGYESYLKRQMDMEALSQQNSKYDYNYDPYLQDRNQSTDYYQKEAYSSLMSGRGPQMSQPLPVSKAPLTPEKSSAEDRKVSEEGPQMSSVVQPPIQFQSKVVLELDKRIIAESVEEYLEEEKRRTGTGAPYLEEFKMPKPTPLRGRFTIVERGTTKVFMFNPAEVGDEKGVNWGEGDVPGASAPVVQFGSGKARIISFELFLDGDRGQVGRGGNSLDISEEINFYRSLEYPSAYGKGPASVAPWIVLFTMGPLYQQLPCLIVKASPKIIYWTPKMEPVRATISISLREELSRSQTSLDVFPQPGFGTILWPRITLFEPRSRSSSP